MVTATTTTTAAAVGVSVAASHSLRGSRNDRLRDFLVRFVVADYSRAAEERRCGGGGGGGVRIRRKAAGGQRLTTVRVHLCRVRGVVG